MAKERNWSQKRINALPEQFNQWYNGETSKSEDMGNMYRDWDSQLHLQHRPNTIKEWWKEQGGMLFINTAKNKS